MNDLKTVVQSMIDLRSTRGVEMTLLAVCPNSDTVLEAAVKSAAANGSLLLLAATLNQVDVDGGYTGWTPQALTERIAELGSKYGRREGLYPCLDHGGPWLKDKDAQAGLDFEHAFRNVKRSIEACVRAGYALLHIDPTVDRSLARPGPVATELVVSRTVELISHAEAVRQEERRGPIAYEVGTEEVHGGLADSVGFSRFVSTLKKEMTAAGLMRAWPCFFVAQVGTNLGAGRFDPGMAHTLFQALRPEGSLVKGHYSDWAEDPAEYPRSGMGGANVGPELTAVEFEALSDLAKKEDCLLRHRAGQTCSGFMPALEQAVVESGRWRKWLAPGEEGRDFRALPDSRRRWLLQTGARYVWTAPAVTRAREAMYASLAPILPDPHGYVVDRIAASMDRYFTAFNLFDSLSCL